MLQMVGVDMVIDADTAYFTQAISMEDHNSVHVQVWILSGKFDGGSTGLTVTIEGSSDLENWSDMTQAYMWSMTSVPSWQDFPMSAPFNSIHFDYVRAKLQNNNAADNVTVSIGVKPVTVYSM